MHTLEHYLSGLEVSQGRHAGQPFEVLPWERRFVHGAFAPGVKSAALAIARGNGKTTLVAGVACAYLDGPMVERRGEVVIVASAFSQARIAFEPRPGVPGPSRRLGSVAHPRLGEHGDGRVPADGCAGAVSRE